MKPALLSVLFAILLLAAATATHPYIFPSSRQSTEQDNGHANNSAEAGQRVIFLLQYLATDYERAVQNGHIIDLFEYDEMQRFARNAITIYQATATAQRQTLNKLRKLEGLIAARASLPEIRKICDEAVASLVKENNLSVAPQRTPNLDYGRSLYQENCTPCHGLLGAGDGASADTLNPKPRDFTDPERMNACTPWQFYHAITFGVEGTAMPSFSEAWSPRLRWNLAFYLMTLRRDFQPLAPWPGRPATPQKFTLHDLATKSNAELAAILAARNRLSHPDSSLKQIVDYYRQNPPELTMADYLTITETGLQRSLLAYLRADSAYAAQLAEDAYWNGFEFMEGELSSQIYLAFERAHAEYQSCIQKKGPPEMAQQAVKLMLNILQQIRTQKGWR
jgi:high-affinity iron transporter